jgi:hypothetical protein
VLVFRLAGAAGAELLCRWDPPTGISRFGEGLAVRPTSSERAQLVAIGGSDVSIKQVVLTTYYMLHATYYLLLTTCYLLLTTYYLLLTTYYLPLTTHYSLFT